MIAIAISNTTKIPTPPMMMRTPRYEVSVSATGSGRLGGGFDFGLTATFSAAGSLSADGQMRHEEYQGGQASLTVSHSLGEDSKVSLGGGYSLAFHSPGDMAGSEWDFIAIARVREHDELAQVVTQRLTQLDGIEKTQTMVAFQQFSAHDLEAMFGLGLEDKQS